MNVCRVLCLQSGQQLTWFQQFWLKTFGKPDGNGGYALSTPNESLVVSILSLGTFFGALLAAPMADFMGRRMGIIAACVVFCVGVAMQTAAIHLPLFVVGRVFAGLGVGMVSCLVPMYQAECSPKWIRGAVVSCYQWAITIGLLLAACVNQGTHNLNNYGSYRIPIALQFIWAGILVTGMLILPESPRYLVKRHDDTGAARSLSRLLSVSPEDADVQAELEDIKANLRLEEEAGENSYADCFRMGPNKILLRTLTGIFIQAWQQLTGYVCVATTAICF
jgi:sugar porter (SP) family MFS transporter